MGMHDEDAVIGRDVGRMDERKANVYRSPCREEEMSDARITSQLAFTVEQLSKTRVLLSELEDRISPVLMPDHSEPANATDMPDRKPASDLSNTIDDLNRFIGTIQEGIINISQRVQL